MRRQNLSAIADDDSQPVIVPRSDKALAPLSPERSRRLRQHLVTALRASRRMKDPERSASPPLPEPAGFAARVARTACSLCKGSCCRGGGDHAYLDEQTMTRVRRANSGLDILAVLRLYLERVPAVSYDGSCLFHARHGCTLSRSLRSDVCNAYFCAGLEAYVTGGDPGAPVVVIAGEGDGMRTSSLLMP
jgi:hypothetical protein